MSGKGKMEESKMMKKITIGCCVAAAFASVLAADIPAAGGKKPGPAKKITAEQFRKVMNKHTGGMIRRPGEQKGRVLVVNALSAEAEGAAVAAAADGFGKWMRVDVGVEKGSFDLAHPEPKGEVTLFAVDDAGLPMSLVAPEGKWALVNVAKLRDARPQFTAARIRKEVARTLARLCGAADSQYPQTLMGCVTKAEELDVFANEKLPMDVMPRMKAYLAGCGVVPYTLVQYRVAVREGWAPAPTNEYQKAIWDQAHDAKERGPVNALKIVPPKK